MAAFIKKLQIDKGETEKLKEQRTRLPFQPHPPQYGKILSSCVYLICCFLFFFPISYLSSLTQVNLKFWDLAYRLLLWEAYLWSSLRSWLKIIYADSLGAVGKESACNVGNLGLIHAWEISPGEGGSNPFQYFCLENPMNRGAWWATVHGVIRVRHDLATKPQKHPFLFQTTIYSYNYLYNIFPPYFNVIFKKNLVCVLTITILMPDRCLAHGMGSIKFAA